MTVSRIGEAQKMIESALSHAWLAHEEADRDAGRCKKELDEVSQCLFGIEILLREYERDMSKAVDATIDAAHALHAVRSE